MANTVVPVNIGPERWMRMPGLASPTGTLGDLFVFSGYADFTGGPEPLKGTGNKTRPTRKLGSSTTSSR